MRRAVLEAFRYAHIYPDDSSEELTGVLAALEDRDFPRALHRDELRLSGDRVPGPAAGTKQEPGGAR